LVRVGLRNINNITHLTEKENENEKIYDGFDNYTEGMLFTLP
jgi:hypothetical protein